MEISCNICESPVKIKNNHAYMQCMCDEEIRIINLKDIFESKNYLRLKNIERYLYSDKENIKLCQEFI